MTEQFRARCDLKTRNPGADPSLVSVDRSVQEWHAARVRPRRIRDRAPSISLQRQGTRDASASRMRPSGGPQGCAEDRIHRIGEEILKAPVMQTGPHLHLLIEPDAYYTHLFSLMGLMAHRGLPTSRMQYRQSNSSNEDENDLVGSGLKAMPSMSLD